MPNTIWGAWEAFPTGPAWDRMVAGLGSESARIYLTGSKPGGGGAEAMQEWFRQLRAPEGWSLTYREHPDYPVARFERYSQYIDVRRAAVWFPEEATPEDCAVAYDRLADLLAKHFRNRVRHAVPLATPALTGRDTWFWTTEYDFPALPLEIRQLIHTTTGQGRIQIVPPPACECAAHMCCCAQYDTIPALFHVDSRFAYGAIGGDTLPVRLVAHDMVDEFLGYTPARYRVLFCAPVEWQHVGVFGVWTEGRWSYPLKGETWADACEVMLAIKHGWNITIMERLIFDTAGVRPLETWRRKMVESLWEPERNDFVRKAIRNIVLHGIGAFAAREGTQVLVMRKDGPRPDVNPEDVLSEREVGDSWHITVRRPLDAWASRFTHPEWSAHIWARMRCRVLDGPGGVGVLNLPPDHVLAVETDGLYLTQDPGWTDDGKVGRFRVKGYTPGPIPRPHSWGEFHALRARGGER